MNAVPWFQVGAYVNRNCHISKYDQTWGITERKANPHGKGKEWAKNVNIGTGDTENAD